MSVPRILIIFAFILSICSPVWADDWSAPCFIENKEGTDVEKSYEGGSCPTEGGFAKYDFTDENTPERDFRRFCSLPSAAIDIRHAPIYLLVASLRR
jgi:hypothetical protein